MLDTKEIIRKLSRLGYRVTAPRRLLVDIISQRDVRFTAADLEQEVAGVAPKIGRASIFRTLELLRNLDMVERIHAEGEPRDAYVVAEGLHHHHLVCSTCGMVTEVMGCKVDQFVGSLVQASGSRPESHWLEIVGVCQRC